AYAQFWPSGGCCLRRRIPRLACMPRGAHRLQRSPRSSTPHTLPRTGIAMAKKESTQHKLDRVRAPRVQLTYDVEVGDAIEKKELPFVAGVVGNFSGNPAERLGKLKDRKCVNVDKDNYDDVLKGMKPRVQMQVDNKLAEDGNSKLGVELTFRSLEDFSPERVANQIEPLRKLLEARQKLADLRNKAAGNDKFEDLLNEVLQNTDKIAQLSKEVGPKSDE